MVWLQKQLPAAKNKVMLINRPNLSVTIQIKATEQYFHVVLFIMLIKVVLMFKSVYEPPLCGHSNEKF